MKKFLIYIAIAAAATLPALVVRFAGIELTPIVWQSAYSFGIADACLNASASDCSDARLCRR